MASEPAASIIVATYNRAYVLRHCITSVLRSDFADWELIVVGDGCSDETEDTVRTFADPRIRFINLPENSGGQALPNNTGLALARGRYIYFLNHDDMFFPGHLSQSLAFMAREQPEISWSPVFVLQRSGLDSGLPDPVRDLVCLDGAGLNGRLDNRSFMIASSWVVERNACRAVGPWLPETQARLSPSQEWLFRAYRQQRRIAFNPHVSVLCIHGGDRRYSYLVRRSPEHERAATWIAAGEPARTALLECAAVEQAARLLKLEWEVKRPRARGVSGYLRALIVQWSRRLGFHPVAVERFLTGHGKGDWIAKVRRLTGEAPELHRDETLHLGDPMAEPFLGSGWHHAEVGGRWTSASRAEILFSLPACSGDEREELVLELAGRPLRLPDDVTFELSGRPVLTTKVESKDTVVRLPIMGRGSFWLTITIRSPTTPHDLTGAEDARVLGFWLSWLRVTSAAPYGDSVAAARG